MALAANRREEAFPSPSVTDFEAVALAIVAARDASSLPVLAPDDREPIAGSLPPPLGSPDDDVIDNGGDE